MNKSIPFNLVVQRNTTPLATLSFNKIERLALAFALHIESESEKLTELLLEYESFEVAQDEISRTLDMLKNIRENRKYFKLRIGSVAAFLPRNQPLYALTCFVVVPSMMASEVHFRIPKNMKLLMPKLLKLLRVSKFFPNIFVSKKKRLDFVLERTALQLDPHTQKSWPLTHAVIFTGTPNHAERLRLLFDYRTLFIANGAGHNPVVVTEKAETSRAVDAVLTLQLYNQGQDCAAPNAILVHKKKYYDFLHLLRARLRLVNIGKYSDRTCRVGPISDNEDLIRIQGILTQNKKWIDPSTPGIIRTSDSIIEPTIICRPLVHGGNYSEVFAPIIFLQKYEDDCELSLYFESRHYACNAMYITVFGRSRYIDNIAGLQVDRRILHRHSSIIHDTHLHAPGVERGTKPYGGYGYGSSSVSINGKIVCGPTLPQRDIFEHLVRPLINTQMLRGRRSALVRMKKIIYRDIRKIVEISTSIRQEIDLPLAKHTFYVDSHATEREGRRYLRVSSEHIYQLLDHPNIGHIATLEPIDSQIIRKLRAFLKRNLSVQVDELTNWIYKQATIPNLTVRENHAFRQRIFSHIYNLIIGRKSGPRLSRFLLETDRKKVCELLDV